MKYSEQDPDHHDVFPGGRAGQRAPKPTPAVTALIQAVIASRERSRFCWLRAVRTADSHALPTEIEADGRACDGNYREALQEALAGRYARAQVALCFAAVKERNYGHDQHSHRALEALRAVLAEALTVTGERNTPRHSDAPRPLRGPLSPLDLEI